MIVDAISNEVQIFSQLEEYKTSDYLKLNSRMPNSTIVIASGFNLENTVTFWVQ